MECFVCLEEREEMITRECCSCKLCEECLLKWNENYSYCPMCRKLYFETDALGNSSETFENLLEYVIDEVIRREELLQNVVEETNRIVGVSPLGERIVTLFARISFSFS